MDDDMLLPPSDEKLFVKLLPGETTQQYEARFHVWLNERDVAMRSKPEVEVLFRNDFATLRAWELQHKTSTVESDDDMSDSEEEGEIREEDKPTVCSVPCLQCASRTQFTGKSVLKTPQYQGFRGRDELLKTRIMSVDEFVKDFGRHGPNGYVTPSDRILPIAIVLRRNESVDTYELVFQKWLLYKDMTLEMLKDDPEEERRYRQCYAYTRVQQQKWKDGFRDTSKKTRRRSRSRSPSRTRHRSRESSRKRRTSINRECWDARCEDSKEAKPCKPIRIEKQPRVYDEDRRLSTVAPSGASQETLRRFKSEVTEQMAPVVKVEGSREVAQRGDDVINTPKAAVLYCRSPSLTEFSCRCKEHAEQGGTTIDLFGCKSETRPATITSAPEHQALATSSKSQPDDQAHVHANVQVKKCSRAISPHSTPNTSIQASRTTQLQDHAEIVQAATDILSQADQVGANQAIRRLVDDYIRFTDQIVVNETAVSDLIIHVKEVENVDKIELSDKVDLIAEEMALISEVKARRHAVLFEIVTQQWTQGQAELERVLQFPAASGFLTASHEQLASAYSKMKQEDEEILALKVTLECRLSLFREGVACQGDADMDALQLCICNLSAESTAKMLLEDQSRRLAMSLLRSTGVW